MLAYSRGGYAGDSRWQSYLNDLELSDRVMASVESLSARSSGDVRTYLSLLGINGCIIGTGISDSLSQ